MTALLLAEFNALYGQIECSHPKDLDNRHGHVGLCRWHIWALKIRTKFDLYEALSDVELGERLAEECRVAVRAGILSAEAALGYHSYILRGRGIVCLCFTLFCGVSFIIFYLVLSPIDVSLINMRVLQIRLPRVQEGIVCCVEF